MNRHLTVCSLLLFAACGGAPTIAPPPAPLPVPQGEIAADELRRDLSTFAADSMRGRETGTEDAERAARFLVSRVQALGLEPAGDSLYVQRVPLQRDSFSPSSRVVVHDVGGMTTLGIGTDVTPLITLGPGVPPTKRSADGLIVFAGYGMPASKTRRDDLAGLDLTGKVVIVVNGAPHGADSATRAAAEAETAVAERLGRILPMRPAAVVVLMMGKGAEGYQQLATQVSRGVSLQNNFEEIPDHERPLPLILLGVPRDGSPLLPAGWPADDRPQAMNSRLIARVEARREAFTGYNIVAVVRGSDPTLRSTYVAYGAHYDHIGVVSPVKGDSIANGADDDGSGSMALLAIARMLQQAPEKPKRSTLFVWHIGEEKGLLGSSWFVDHPTVPIDSIVAQLNADMIGRNAASLLYTVGPRAAPNGQSRRLGAVVDSVNAAQPLPFAIDHSWDAATHPEHIYERSDHFNYARKGIPIVFFTTGMHADYHAPSDEVSKIDFEKMARVARLMRDVGLAVGNSAKRPR
ncbi:MAG: M20/M25/M40 family metallo-hydrolase [Gemmatimonadaceae bacterium]